MHLRRLEVSHSNIVAVPCIFLYDLPLTLNNLDLGNNKIYTMQPCDIKRMENLRIINLSNQKYIYLKENLSPKKSGNVFTTISDPIFRDYKNVSRENSDGIVLHKTSIIFENKNNSLAIQQNALQFQTTSRYTKCWRFPSSLSAIDVSHSKLACDLLNNLCDFSYPIKTLNMSYQKFTECQKSFWFKIIYFLKLECLDLSGNQFKDIPFDAFSSFRKLKRLSLHHNFLAVVEFQLQTEFLEDLDLSDNNILYISKKLTEQLDKIAEGSKLAIHLSGNKLVCDCERLDFIAWLRYSNAIYQKDKLLCNLKSNMTYSLSKIAELHEKLKAECIAPEVLKGCIGGFLILNIVLGLISAIWHKRWKIRYLLAIGRKNVSPYHPIEECEIELEYDVYISYERDYDLTSNETLHEFVANKIYPELQRRGFKVLIREELEPGVGLYNAISHALRRCKKVVSLISKDYCRDYWNVFEFNMAVLEGIYTKRQVIIPVALENVEREDLHTEIYAYLRSGSVSYFSRNVRDEDLFDFLCEKIGDNREFE